ncbi:uncharacterized protein KD926_009150 [Aspergillus affinis]|uniref:uncharacterized protein n=1 Tax=Aspergillus affinis TaxID=1070780 RepID=UPI0022FF0B3D|nr:uncharacterized protein KD926_009150 [Aspergillus affinis]KAI9039680.1 hypothetical protein KD926_009150 [Aspergillus affinis]
MPIPTRSLSLRDPRKQPSTLGRTASTRTASTSISSGPSNPPSSAGSDNGTKTKSLLPVRDEARSTASPGRIPKPQESRLPERGTRLVQRPPAQQDPRPVEPTGLTRRQSLIRPSALKPTSSVRTPSVSTGSTTPLTTPKRATFAQGPPSPSKSDATSNQNGRAGSPKKTSMAPPPRPVRSTSLRQPASSSAGIGSPATARGHVRHRSQVTAVPSQASKKLEPPSPSTTTTRSRAGFTTYQQQFSPRKASDKPAAAQSSGGSTQPDPALISASWPEIASLQTELLQLSLLHRSSLRQNVQWRNQAEAQLRSKYDSVAGRYRTMIVEEKEYQRRLNGLALSGWLKNTREHNGQQGFEEQIRILSQVTQEVCDLNDSLAGRYTLAVQGFEDWFHKAREITNYRLAQQGGGVVGHGHVVFIDPIDPAWKEEAYAMTLQLELCARQLESLDILGYGEVERLEDSALLRMARGLDEMVKLMVDELNAIRKIEADITRSERQWVSQLTRQFMTRRSQETRSSELGMWRQSSLKS